VDDAVLNPKLAGPLPPKSIDLDGVERATRDLLVALGQSGKAEVMANTPRRVAELYNEWFNAPWADIEEAFKVFPNPEADREDAQLITVLDAHYTSLCEHHLAPAFGVAHVAYVPGEYIVGYSKLKKGLNYLARQPQLNERIVRDTLDFVEARLQPKGIALVTQSVHCCIAVRTNAPAQEVVTISEYRGLLASERYGAAFDRQWANHKPLFLGQ